MANPPRGTRLRRARGALGVVACAATVSLAASLVSPAATGQSSTSGIGALVTEVSRAQANVDELNLSLGGLQESVNQALVDLHDAQARAEQARLGKEEAQRRLEEAQESVEKLRAELGELTRTHYRGANTSDVLTAVSGATSQRDVLERDAFLRQRTSEQRAKLEEAERARAEAANEAAVLKEASELADATAQEAVQAEAQARQLLNDNQAALEASLAERDAAEAQLAAAQTELAEVRPEAGGQEPAAAEPEQEAAGVAAAPYATPRVQVDVPQDVILQVEQHVAEIAPEAAPDATAVADAVRVAAEMSSELDLSTPNIQLPELTPEMVAQAAAIAAGVAIVGAVAANHTSFENPFAAGSSTASSAGSSAVQSAAQNFDGRELVSAFAGGIGDALGRDVASVLPEIATAETVSQEAQSAVGAANPSQVESVIARAESMIGTPYVWGGGDANGPTTGVNGGSVSGFDCSGLVLYAFAGAGIALPHYTGYQYQRGTQVPVSEAQRGDLLFWGPGGSQHVAIYLGDGMMIEAPQAGQNVTTAPVRWSGMAPNAVRLL